MPMKKTLSTALMLLILSSGLILPIDAFPQTMNYPKARKGDVVDDCHGTKVPDPYRWLEDTDSEETKAWIEAQNKITFPWLEAIPERKALHERLTMLWNYEKFGIPSMVGGRYFYTRNDGLQNQSVFYWAESLTGEPRVLIDPNKLSKDGTVALATRTVSPDGKWLVYGLSSGGSDWSEWRVREIETGEDLKDHLKWIKHSNVAWDQESKGFYYSRYEEPAEGEMLQQVNYNQKLYYHQLDTDQSEDKLVYERPDEKEFSYQARASDDGRYLVITIGKGTERKNQLFYSDLEGPDNSIKPLVDTFKAQFRYIDNNGPIFWIFTDHEAPMGRVIAMDVTKPEEKEWQTVIPEGDAVLRRVNVVNDTFIASYLKDACSEILKYDLNGKLLGKVDLPGPGTASGFGGRRDDKETFYRFTGFSDPGTIFRFDATTGKSDIFRRPEIAFDPDEYVTNQVFYPSKDGTMIPMFLTHKKGLKRDGTHPVLMIGYGGFNIPMTPGFYIERLVWMEQSGILVMPNLRGGGEYGRAWHEAGMKKNKQNTFDDFIAAAEWLIENRYTAKERLAIYGASNGGLLVGACMTQRPDLFGACLPAVGVMDMLRFHKFTIGWAWVSDYGSPEDPDDFKVLYAYSPYHNLRKGVAYPPTLVTTADHDDRVVPGHSFKFAARLQEVQSGSAPVLIRIETRAGHGAGKPTTKRIEEATDRLSFLVKTLKMNDEP